MTNPVPDWLAPQPTQSNSTPDWLSVHPKREPASRMTAAGNSPEGKALLFKQFEMVLPRLLERVCEGDTLATAIKELPIPIDAGAFMRWLRKKPEYHDLYKEAKEVRTEAWAGEVIRHAKGEDQEGNPSMEDTARSRLIVDTYKWLMGADHRKQYGDTKTIEMNTTISITAALAQAQERVMVAQVIDDADVIDADEVKMISSGSDEYKSEYDGIDGYDDE